MRGQCAWKGCTRKAVWVHRHTGDYHCGACAHRINELFPYPLVVPPALLRSTDPASRMTNTSDARMRQLCRGPLAWAEENRIVRAPVRMQEPPGGYPTVRPNAPALGVLCACITLTMCTICALFVVGVL